MLKRIPDIISPELMHVLMSMGHGDEVCIADGNFPGAGLARRLVRLHGVGVVPVLEAVMRFLPLDQYVSDPASVMAVVPGDSTVPSVWDAYRRVLSDAEGRRVELTLVERFAFYERARSAFAVVMTSETALYANLLLRKGVVTDDQL